MKKRKDFKSWAESISQCSECQSYDLLKMGVDVHCMKCDWSNGAAYVELGGMDNTLAAAIDCFVDDEAYELADYGEVINDDVA